MKNRALLSLLSLAAPVAAFAVSPYINKVYDFRPAPGQFVNVIPEYEPGDDYNSMLAKAQEALAFDRMPGAVSLGAFGGFVVFGFDHTVANVAGEYDFKIYGNAIISDKNAQGGSCEPGVVWVAADTNGNGLPDDEWYELLGSEADRAIHGFSVTYRRPDPNHKPTPDPSDKHLIDTTYLPFTASDGTAGYLAANDYHLQSYWPEWLDSEELTFTGVRLPDNAMDVSGNGSYFVLKMFPYGYADNCPNSQDPGFKIDWAVDAEGNPAHLPGIDFVKVVTGSHQQAGSLGETSTEVCGAEDLHPEVAGVSAAEIPTWQVYATGGILHSVNPADGITLPLYDTRGIKVADIHLPSGATAISLKQLAPGLYLLPLPDARTLRIRL